MFYSANNLDTNTSFISSRGKKLYDFTSDITFTYTRVIDKKM